jgi:hypothetical protein
MTVWSSANLKKYIYERRQHSEVFSGGRYDNLAQEITLDAVRSSWHDFKVAHAYNPSHLRG